MSTGATGFLERYDSVLNALPGDSALRAAAADAFRAAGLPGSTHGRRVEAWKYTSLRPVAETKFRRDAALRHEAETILASLPLLDAPRIVFVDGVLRRDLSMPLSQAVTASGSQQGAASPQPVVVNPGQSQRASAQPATATTAQSPIGASPPVMAGVGRPSTPSSALSVARFADQPDFGTLTWPDREPMVALNTMLAEDGAILHVPAGHDAGIVQLISIATSDADIHPRHSIHVGENARLTLLEIAAGQGTYLLNTVAEIHVADGAALTHIRLQDEAATAFHVSTTYADVQAGGTYDSFTLNIGARLSRTEVHAQLSGAGAAAHLNAAQLLSGSQHADFTSVVGHTAPNCQSRQTVKNVLADRSRGVFQGRIEVARAAQKTDGYQMNQALLLSPYAEVDTKPELEIFADDVKCSHGATVGELDADQVFYLRSRGVPEAAARAILVRAFLTEALDAVTDETIHARLEAAVANWWERQAA